MEGKKNLQWIEILSNQNHVHTFRARVPGGWLLRSDVHEQRYVERLERYDHLLVASSQVFIPGSFDMWSL
jgi:hypothetical protein